MFSTPKCSSLVINCHSLLSVQFVSTLAQLTNSGLPFDWFDWFNWFNWFDWLDLQQKTGEGCLVFSILDHIEEIHCTHHHIVSHRIVSCHIMSYYCSSIIADHLWNAIIVEILEILEIYGNCGKQNREQRGNVQFPWKKVFIFTNKINSCKTSFIPHKSLAFFLRKFCLVKISLEGKDFCRIWWQRWFMSIHSFYLHFKLYANIQK